MKLNDKTVSLTRPTLPAGKREYTFFDEDLSCFGLRLREGGSRTWVFQYWRDGMSRRYTIGKFPKVSAKAARNEVSGVNGLAAKVSRGINPATEKAENLKRVDTFGNVVEMYLADAETRLRPRSLVEITRHLRVHCKPLHNKPVNQIGKRDIAGLLAAIRANAPVTANRVRSSISAMFVWAAKADTDVADLPDIESNPAAFTNTTVETPRDRVLSDDELAKVWAALPEGDYGSIVKVLMLTGMRREEVGGLRWDEVDFKSNTITLPPGRVKNKTRHVLPMSARVRDILKSQIAYRDL